MGGTVSASAAEPHVERRSYRWVAVPLLAFGVFSLTAGLLAHHEPRSKGYFRHMLGAAGTNGVIGPNLDSLRPTYAQVSTKVRGGGGGMPSFAGRLSAQQIRDLAAFVATSAGRK